MKEIFLQVCRIMLLIPMVYLNPFDKRNIFKLDIKETQIYKKIDP
jgi:hypothetical protein